MHLSFLTALDEDFGIVWGFSTGERGEKYRIAPGVKLGFILSLRPSPASTLTLSATAQFGADLSERSCRADYGAIGGVQRVNCRLAAVALAPEATLAHRFDMEGFDDSRVALAYELRF